VVGAEEQGATRAALLESGAASLAAQSLLAEQSLSAEQLVSAAEQTLEPDRLVMADLQLGAASVQPMAV